MNKTFNEISRDPIVAMIPVEGGYIIATEWHVYRVFGDVDGSKPRIYEAKFEDKTE